METGRTEICHRILKGRCPNCGYSGMFRTWFCLRKSCLSCNMVLEKDESGFYLGTTSIGYVMAIIFVIISVCFLVILNVLNVWTGVIIGILTSIALFLTIYPLMLCWVILIYYIVQAEELPTNQKNKESEEIYKGL